MTEIEFKIGDLSSYVPYEGEGWPDHLPFDGYVKARVKTFTPTKFESGNFGFKAWLVVQDEDAAGKKLVSNVIATGEDKRGQPNVRKLGDALLSAGMPQEKIVKATGSPAKDVQKYMEGKDVYVEVSGTKYKERIYSEPDRWISSAQYEGYRAVGSHRRPQAIKDGSAEVHAPGTGNGATAPAAGDVLASGGAPKSAAADPMTGLFS